MKYIATLSLLLFSIILKAQQVSQATFRTLKVHVVNAANKPGINYSVDVYKIFNVGHTDSNGDYALSVPNTPVIVIIRDGKIGCKFKVNPSDITLNVKFSTALAASSDNVLTEWEKGGPNNTDHIRDIYHSSAYYKFIGKPDPDLVDVKSEPNIEIPLSSSPQSNTDEIYKSVETVAQYKTGAQDWDNYTKANLKYPEKAKAASLHGRVIIYFVIEKDGSTSSFKILRSLSAECDAEAVRLVKDSGKWKPATANQGKVVRSENMLLVTF